MIKFYLTIKDFIFITIHSNWFSKRQFETYHTNSKLRILGNGQSLNNTDLIDNEAFDYMVVNRHVLADNYVEIKPRYYVLADPHFFTHQEGLDILHKIDEITFWDMKVLVPFTRRSVRKWKKHFKNEKIEVLSYNSFPFRGYKTIAYFLYSIQLSMPLVQNVLVAAIMLGLQMRYNIIELYGVEHSWTKYLFVGEDNLVYLENPHFYDKERIVPKPYKELQHVDEYPMWFALECFMKMFKSYIIIRDYAKSKSLRTVIINKTPGSFIDAFRRM